MANRYRGRCRPRGARGDVYWPDGVTPPVGADVWVSTDEAGANVIAGTLLTDPLGRVTFMLDAGTYYLWVQSTSVTFDNPAVIEVS